MMFHAIQLPHDITLDVHSTDTDVLVLFLRLCAIIPSFTRFVCKSHKDPFIIKSVSEKLWYDKCRTLIALHAISGTVVTGNYYGKAKDVAWSAFQKSSTDTVAPLMSLTKNEAICESNFTLLEGFLSSLYNSNLKTPRCQMGHVEEKSKLEHGAITSHICSFISAHTQGWVDRRQGLNICLVWNPMNLKHVFFILHGRIM